MILKSWDGYLFDGYDGEYDAWIGDGSHRALPAVQARLVERVGAWPLMSGIGRPGKRFTMFIWIEGSDVDALRIQMFQWFDPEDETPKALVATDDDGVSNERYTLCTCETLQPVIDGGTHYSQRLYAATMAVSGDVRWRSTVVDRTTWLVTSDGDTETIENAGEDEAYPILTIEPTQARAETWEYYTWDHVVWRAAEGDTGYPMRLTALDTAALVETATTTTLNGAFNAGVVTCAVVDASSFPNAGMAYITDAVTADEQIRWTGKAGNNLTGVTRGVGGTGDVNHSGGQTIALSKMLANGDDLRVEVDGVEDESRWLDGMDSANTYIWLNLDWEAAQSYTLTNDIGAGDTVTTVDVDEDISGAPTEGAFLLNSEVFVYTSKNETDQTFLGVTRAARGTSAGGHTAADTLYWLQHDVKLRYGNEDAGAPATDNNYKPAFELTSSSNTSWVYAIFGEDDGLRAKQWDQTGRCYEGDHGASPNPWTEIGLLTDSGGYSARWKLYNPCYITAMNCTNGEKRANAWLGDWDVEIQSSTDGAAWGTEYVVPAPGGTGAWGAWSRNETITASRPYVSFRMSRTTGAQAHYAEIADITITLNGSYTPVTTRGSEQSLYPLECTITNNTTGKAISLSYSMEINDEIEVDTDEKTVTDLGDDSRQFQALTVVSGPRRQWLPLDPGNNELQYDEDGAAAVTVTVEFWERYYG